MPIFASSNSSADDTLLLSRIELDSIVIERCSLFSSSSSASSSAASNAASAENRPNSFSYLIGCFARSIEIGDQIAANEKVGDDHCTLFLPLHSLFDSSHRFF